MRVQGGEVEERESRMVLGWGEKQIWRNEGDEEWADMNGLLATENREISGL